MKKILLMLALACPLFAPLALLAQTTTITGTKVLNGTGGLLASGQWCLGATCFAVTNGVIAPGSTVTSATATVTVVNGGTTYLTVPSVAVTGTTFNWDGYVLSGAASGMGVPRIAGAIGATYTQTDASNKAWAIVSENGQLVWTTSGGSGGGGSPGTSGLYAGNGVPTFPCTAPCVYTRADASPASAATYTMVAPAGVSSTNWVLQVGPAGSGVAALTNNVLQGNPGSATKFFAAGDSTFTTLLGSMPADYATLLGIPSSNWTINAVGGSSIEIMGSCSSACTYVSPPIPSSVGANVGTPNSQYPVYHAGVPLGITSNSKSLLGFGFNNLTFMGSSPSAAALDYYQGQVQAWMMELGITDSQKMTALTNCTSTGTVASSDGGAPGAFIPPGGLMLISNGATLTCTGFPATYAGIVGYKNTAASSTFSLTVNGNPVTDPATGSPTISQTAPYAGADGAAADIYAIGASGLPGGTATVVVTCVSCSNSDPIVVARPFGLVSGSTTTSSPSVVKVLTPYQVANGTCSNCASGHSDAQVNIVRSVEKPAVQLLRDNGLNVAWVDPNGTAGSNPNLVAYTGKSELLNTVGSGGSGYTGTVTFSFTGGCTVQPVAPTFTASGGTIPTGQYYMITSGACTSAPTCTVVGNGSGATCSASYTSDYVHWNMTGGAAIAASLLKLGNSAMNTSDSYLPSLSSAVASSSCRFTGIDTLVSESGATATFAAGYAPTPCDFVVQLTTGGSGIPLNSEMFEIDYPTNAQPTLAPVCTVQGTGNNPQYSGGAVSGGSPIHSAVLPAEGMPANSTLYFAVHCAL